VFLLSEWAIKGPDRAYLPPRKHRLVEQLSEQPFSTGMYPCRPPAMLHGLAKLAPAKPE
jgi:hypothetical protein